VLYQPHYGINFMSISKFLLVAAISFCALGNLSATDSAKHAKKHYLDEKDISISKDGIIVCTKNGAVKVKRLRSDKDGVYVFSRDLCKVDVCKGDERYYCRNCKLYFRDYSEYAMHYCRKR
jgi:hypothetical protein